jgi:hypothetical protein
MPEERDCFVKLVDDHGVEHSVKVRAESVYEAALNELKKLERVGWEPPARQAYTHPPEGSWIHNSEALCEWLVSSFLLCS